QGIGTINDDDAVPTVSIADVTVDEGDDAVFAVSLSNPSSEAITVTFTIDDVTATETGDYTEPATLTVTIPAGSTTVNVTVPTVEDTTNEPTETFEVNITDAETNTTNTTLTVTDNQGIGTINDDDGVPTVSIADVTVDEGDDAVFAVSLSNPSSEAITVTFTIDDVTAVETGDYTEPATLTVTIPAGSTTVNVTVPTVEDTTNEPTETFEVNITDAETDTTNTTLTVSDNQGIGTINDDDGVPTVSIADVTVDEGDDAVFAVSLSNPSSEAITVTFTIDDVTAVETGDYTEPATLTVTIPAGSTTVNVTVPTVEDTTNEPTETFEVNITDAETDTTNTTLTVSDNQGIGTINDDDPVPTVSINDVTVDEGDDAVFAVSLSNPSSEAITVTFTIDDVTAVETGDYTEPATLTVTIPAGSTTVNVTVPTVEDTTNEPTETFEVNITDAETNTTNTTLTVSDNQGIGTINDDDPVPTVSINDVTVDEGDDAVFAVSLSNPSSEAITVTFTIDDVTAVETGDYTEPATLTVTIPAGSTTVNVTVPTVEDTTNEPTETFEVNITDAETDTTNTTLTVSDNQGIGTINDDDPVPTVSINDVTVDEGDDAVFAVSLSNPSSEAITVTFTIDDVTAVETGDYTEPATLTVTIPAGSTTVNVTVPTVEDLIFEFTETFEVNITNAETDTTSTLITATDAQGIGTINDDEIPNPLLQVTKTIRVPGSVLNNVIEYDIVVTNIGNTFITDIEITDANADAGSIVGSPIVTLAPGDSVTVTANQTITQTDIDAGFVENSATATGDSP
ncbi:Calx-beta domain-containing protein, partial [Aquimarina sp. 2201CG14-23]|uniref:Calx-beta domain-containing protein n=1 Tax=Aquimarina mycalae TaxID=3040073 RepID=UPI002477F880